MKVSYLDDQARGSITRRNLFRLSAGALTVLPSVAGGFLVPTPAYAATGESEEYGGEIESSTCKVEILKASEVGFYVVDLTAPKEPPMYQEARVPNAKVRVTSLSNNRWKEGTTNEEGIARIDIAELASNPDNKPLDELIKYEFQGTITVECDGYRTYETARVTIKGGIGLRVPTRPKKDAGVYPHLIAFDTWDVLYTEHTFDLAATVDDRHRFDIEFRNCAPNEETTIALKKGKNPVPITYSTFLSSSDGVAATSLEGQFLQLGHMEALEEGNGYSITFTQKGSTQTVNIGLAIKAMGEDIVEDSDDNFSPMEMGGLGQMVGLRWPEQIPIIGGEPVSLPLPKMPINVRIDPWGLLELTIVLPMGFSYDKENKGDGWQDKDDGKGGKVTNGWGWDQGTGWTKTPMEEFKNAWKDFKDDTIGDWQNFKGARDANEVFGTGKSSGKYDSLGAFHLEGTAEFVLCASWEVEKDEETEEETGGLFRGGAALNFLISCELKFTQQYFWGPIPILIMYGVEASFSIKVNFECFARYPKDDHLNNISRMWTALGDRDRWEFNRDTTGINFTLNISPFASLGVGVKGFNISVELRFTLTIYYGIIFFIKKTHPELPVNHIMLGCDLTLSLNITAFLFSKSFKLLTYDAQPFLDNWHGETGKGFQVLPDESDYFNSYNLEAMATESLIDLMSDMTMITDDMLYDMNENQGTAGVQALAETEYFDWETMRGEDIEKTMEDGTTMSYAVYKFPEYFNNDDQVGTLGNDEEEVIGFAATDGVAELGEEEVALGAQSKPTARVSLSSNVVYGDFDKGIAALADDIPQGSTSIVPKPAVDKLGRLGGIVPKSDITIAEGVLGDPRIKVVQFEHILSLGSSLSLAMRATYAFRIAAVLVDGKPRTRLIATLVAYEVAEEGIWTSKTKYDYNYIKEHMKVERVLDFEINDVKIDGRQVSHKDMYDYDFDVVCRTSKSKVVFNLLDVSDDCIDIVLISGTRNPDDGIADVATNLVFTHLSAKMADVTSNEDTFSWAMRESIAASEVLVDNSYTYHMLNNIHCILDDAVTDYTLMVGFLDRMANNAQDVLSNDGGDNSSGVKNVRAMPGFFVVNYNKREIVRVKMKTVKDSMEGRADDAKIFEMDLSPNIAGYNTLSMRSSSTTYFFLLNLNEDDGTFNVFSYGGNYDTKLVPYPVTDNFQGFLAAMPYYEGSGVDREEKRRLEKVEWDIRDVMNPVLRHEPTGLDDFGARDFGVNRTGSYIFWPQSHTGESGRVYEYNENTNETYFEADPDLPAYKLMACRINDMKFSDPFVVAELEHDMVNAQILVTAVKEAPIEILSKHDVDTGVRDAKGEIVYTACNINFSSVPNLRCATATMCAAVNPFMMPGSKSFFDIMIRNDGNTFLSGCTVKMYEHTDAPEGSELVEKDGKTFVTIDGKDVWAVEVTEKTETEDGIQETKKIELITEVEGATTEIKFGEATLQESSYNPIEDDKFLNVEPDWSLAPGKTSMYRAKVPIPAIWAAEATEKGITQRKVSFVASKPVMVAGSGLAGQADDDMVFQEYVAHPGEVRVNVNRTSLDQPYDQRFMTVVPVGDKVAPTRPLHDAPMLMGDVDINGGKYNEVKDGSGYVYDANGNAVTPEKAAANNEAVALGAISEFNGGGAESSYASVNRTPTAKTADITPSAVPAAAAALGAAAMAYVMRRAKNQGAQDDEK